jgi:hypothetical protein
MNGMDQQGFADQQNIWYTLRVHISFDKNALPGSFCPFSFCPELLKIIACEELIPLLCG